jgi:hypothetical protein
VLFVLHNPVLPSQAVILHLVEAPTKVLVELMRNLAEVSGWALPGTGPMNLSTAAASGAPLGKSLTSPSASPNSHMIRVEPRNQPLMRSAVLLSFTEEVPREFRFWAFRAHVKMPSDDFISSTLGANLQRDALKLCFETLKNMLELGREVGTMSVEKAIEFIQGPENLAPTLAPPLPKQVANKLPSAERLLAYIHQLPDLCSIQEWLEIYDTPIDFTLENEKVWPVEPFLKY